MPRGRPKKVRERPSFSASRKRLEVRYVDKDFESKEVPRWFNDQDGRPERALEAGYRFVDAKEVVGVGDREVHSGNTDVGSKVSRVVGRTEQGHPIRAYLMAIPMAYYKEDQAEKEERNALVDKAIRAGKAGGAEIENKYGDVTLS
jgi:hypothetical protein